MPNNFAADLECCCDRRGSCKPHGWARLRSEHTPHEYGSAWCDRSKTTRGALHVGRSRDEASAATKAVRRGERGARVAILQRCAGKLSRDL